MTFLREEVDLGEDNKQRKKAEKREEEHRTEGSPSIHDSLMRSRDSRSEVCRP